MADTSIEWTDKVWNPVTGCSKVSVGCRNCYAERVAHRFWGDRKFTDVQCHPERLDQPLRWRKPRRIFVDSMGDLFHEAVPDEFLDRVFAVMALAPQHTFQVLTKRADRMCDYVSNPGTPFRVQQAIDALESQPVDTEEIRPIYGYPGYFASSHGHIYSEKRGARRRMQPDASKDGHLRVQLHRAGKFDRRGDRLLVHRLILETFVGSAPSSDAQGCHKDRNPANNALSNLSWGDHAKNLADSRRHGTHRRYSKLTDTDVSAIRKRLALGESACSIAPDFKVSDTQIRNIRGGRQWAVSSSIEWPLQNCWNGVSVEDQKTKSRIDVLRETPAAIRLLSLEPLLEDLGILDLMGIHHVICGAESGPGARPCNVEWIRSIVRQCREAEVPCFVKQLGANIRHVGRYDPAPKRYERVDPDGCAHLHRIVLHDHKGADPSEWPEDLRVRELPASGFFVE